MFCKRCGAEIGQETIYCPDCGIKIDTEQPFSSSRSTYTSYNAQPYQGYGQHNRYNQSNQSHNQQYSAPLYTTQKSTIPNNNTLLLEVILSLFGIFGVGWLMAGETTTGIILLVCSIVIYWPFMIFGTLLTFGLGLICLGPLAITAIIVNALVFNTILQRKRQQQAFPPMPPPFMY